MQYSTLQYLGPDDRDGEEGGEDPDGDHHPPAVAQRAEGAGVVRVHNHHKPAQYSTTVQYSTGLNVFLKFYEC